MIAVRHQLVAMVDREYFVLGSLISDMPKLYSDWVDSINKQLEEEARAAAGDDDEIFWSICSSNYSALAELDNIPDQSRGYILAAIHAFFERNVRNVYKELGVEDYSKASVTIDSVFKNCNVPIETNKALHDEIELFGLIRNNLSHGRLSNEVYWQRLIEYVEKSKSLEMQDDVIFIKDKEFLIYELDLVNSFFALVFKLNPKFKTRYFGEQNN